MSATPISFVPAIGQSVRVEVPRYHTTDARLRFSATFPNHAEHDESILQLWTDAPIAGDNSSNDWTSLNFGLPTRPGGSESLATVDLSSGDEDRSIDHSTITLYLEFSVSLTAQRQFSFTYRRVYPSGEVQWLGGFGDNGTVTMDSTLTDGHLSLSEGWSTHPNGLKWEGESSQIAHLTLNTDDLQTSAVWAFGQNGLTSNGQEAASLIFFLPVNAVSILLPQLLVLACSSPSIVVDSGGSVTISDKTSRNAHGDIILQTVSSQNIDNILKYARSTVKVVDLEGHLQVSSSTAAAPTSVAIIPRHLRVSPESTNILVKLSTLISTSAQIGISTSSCRSFQFLNVPSDGLTEEVITISAGSFGGRFTVGKIHNLTSEWQIYITSPHTVGNSSAKLPTPPPSPLLRPVTRVSQTSATPSFVDSHPPTPSERAEPEDNGEQPHRATLPAPISTKMLNTRPHPAVPYTRYLFVIIGLFLKNLVRRIIGYFLGRVPTSRAAATSPTYPTEATPLLYSDPPSPVTPLAPVASTLPSPSSSKSSHLTASDFSISIEIPGAVTFFMRPSLPDCLLAQVSFEFNGKSVSPSANLVENSTFFLTFQAPEVGEFRIRTYN